MRSFFFCVALLSTLSHGAWAQQRSSIPLPDHKTILTSDQPTILRPESPKTAGTPPFGAWGGAQCDDSGNLYLNVSSNFDGGAILRISKDGAHVKAYDSPRESSSDSNARVGFVDFAISPSGRLRELLQNDDVATLVDFDSDGTVKHRTKLDIPEHVALRRFVTFDDEAVLINGFFGEQAPASKRGKNFVALFDSAGRLRKELRGFPDVDLNTLDSKVPEAGVAVGQDGNAYFLTSNNVLVLSESGEIVRRIAFEKPERKSIAARIRVSQGTICIVMASEGKDHMAVVRFMVLDAMTGERIGYYRNADELENVDLCFSRTDGFTFLRVEDGQVKFVSAPLR